MHEREYASNELAFVTIHRDLPAHEYTQANSGKGFALIHIHCRPLACSCGNFRAIEVGIHKTLNRQKETSRC